MSPRQRTILLLVGCGCVSGRGYVCEVSAECRRGGEAGWCEGNGACSFADPSCSSGRRFGEEGPGAIAGSCVTTGTDGDGPQVADARTFVDATVIDGAPCQPWSWAPDSLDPCAFSVGGALILTGQLSVLDSDAGTLTTGATSMPLEGDVLAQPGGRPVRVVSVAGFMLTGSLELRGSSPVVLLVHGEATIAGTIVASAGAGAASTCIDSGGEDGRATTDSVSQGSGGGGGAYGALGGDGGYVDIGPSGGDGGHSTGDPLLLPLRGGCGGGAGGALLASSPPAGGAGGGAIRVTVRDRLRVLGQVQAPGLGGRGGRGGLSHRDGGGGGGSGGAIFLEAQLVQADTTAALCANGGAGGEGNDNRDSGADGQDGLCSLTRAICPGIAFDGGNGGSGGTRGTPSGQQGQRGERIYGSGNTGGGGAGGGGGSVGRIRIRSVELPSLDGVITPAAQVD